MGLAALVGASAAAGASAVVVRLRGRIGALRRGQARERLLAAAVEQSAEPIVIMRADGVVVDANGAFLAALGHTRAQALQLRFRDLLDDSVAALDAQIAASLAAGRTWRGTLVMRRRDASTFPAHSTVVGFRERNADSTHFVAMCRDATEELRLRDQLVHSERLSAVAELIAGVAHEINNPLQVIVGCTELLLEESHQPRVRADLETVAREASRAGQIVRSLLSFVRGASADRTPIDLNEVVRATLDIRRPLLERKGLTLEMDLAEGPLTTVASRDQIQQVLVNLIANAEHVLEDRPDGQVSIRTSTTGDAHAIEVSDNGPGVSPDLRGRIFEPFFTTKDVGMGTGLGLSISLGIASGHGGTLELCPLPTGACFRLTLPALPAEPGAGPGRDKKRG